MIFELEHLIGSECYNPNSHDAWTDTDGCKFRYPVTATYKNGLQLKMRYVSPQDTKMFDGETVKSLKYKFGSNELLIGIGLTHVLEYLEDRYNLDFNKLEKERKQKASKSNE